MEGSETLPTLAFLVLLLIALVWFRKWRSHQRPSDAYQPVYDPAPSPDGEFADYKVVGTSRYQSVLGRIAGEKTEDAVEIPVTVSLAFENNNRFDPNAVAVMIGGDLVGYLSRDDSELYRDLYDDNEEVDGLIVGGWKRGSDEGSFGVRIDLAQTSSGDDACPY